MDTDPQDASDRSDDEPLADRPMSWPVVETRDLHRDDWVVALREDVITRPGHSEQFSRISLEHPGAVVVLAVDLFANRGGSATGRLGVLWQRTPALRSRETRSSISAMKLARWAEV